MPAAENNNNFWNLGRLHGFKTAILLESAPKTLGNSRPAWVIYGSPRGSAAFLPSRRFLHSRLRCGIGGMIAPVLFHAQPDQNRKHNEADDPFFLSRENEHQLRRGLT
jgi:hypothetical protein